MPLYCTIALRLDFDMIPGSEDADTPDYDYEQNHALAQSEYERAEYDQVFHLPLFLLKKYNKIFT